MRILVYGINFAPELTGIGKYTGEMSAWLHGRGHDVRVVTAPPYYPDWRVHDGYANRYHVENHGGMQVYRCPLYIPARPSALKRILHLLSFAISSFFVLVTLLRWRPRVMIVVEPTLATVPAALLYARLTGARIVLHIQDYEIDAMLGLGMVRFGQLIKRLAYGIEGWLMRRFDRVSSISQSMLRIARQKGVNANRTLFFPNWVDTSHIAPPVDRQGFRARWNLSLTDKVVLYSGNMGQKQGLELVLQAAERYLGQPNVRFVMVGQGAARPDLEAEVSRLRLDNVMFQPLQAYEDLPAMLAMADVHLVIQKRGVADVVLPSKLTSILAVGGHAIMTAAFDTELGLLVDKFPGVAVCVEPESLEAFCVGLDQLLATDTRQPNQQARDYALHYIDREAVLGRFEQDLIQLAQE